MITCSAQEVMDLDEDLNHIKIIKKKKMKMTNYVCKGCGTKYSTSASTPPPSPAWNDGHVCQMTKVEEKVYSEKDMDAAYDKGIADSESKRAEARMQAIGQNGNDGEHYGE